VLNIIPLMDNDLKEAFKILSPKNLIVDRSNGKFNYGFNVCRDQMLGIHTLLSN
jgi:hypothetical protein